MKTLRGNISKSAKAEVPPQTPPSWPRGFGVGRACAALYTGLNKDVVNFFSFYFSVWCGIAEEMRRAGGVSLRGFVEVLGRREFALEKKLSLFERSEFDNFFSGFSKISTP